MWHLNHAEGRKKICSTWRVLVILEVLLLKALDLRLINGSGCMHIRVWISSD